MTHQPAGAIAPACVQQIFRGDLNKPAPYEGPRDEPGIVKYLKKQVGWGGEERETRLSGSLEGLQSFVLRLFGKLGCIQNHPLC